MDKKNGQITIELPSDGMSLPEFLYLVEIDLIQQALIKSSYVKTEAARLLGIKRTTLVGKMKRLGMNPLNALPDDMH